ncbi:MAG: T9SS type A sorting domain-containing protein, partial [Bacteroidia bacterium]|nr:T9SS type A sorting domain-containing protein [Bacteroidia bacterium]
RTMQAELKRVAGNFLAALTDIDAIRVLELTDFESFVLDKLECQNHAEQDLRQGLVSPAALFETYPCLETKYYDQYFVCPADNVPFSGTIYDAQTLLPLENITINFTTPSNPNISTTSLQDGSYQIILQLNQSSTVDIEVNQLGYLPYSHQEEITLGQSYLQDIYLIPEENNAFVIEDENLSISWEESNADTDKSILLMPNPASKEAIIQWKGSGFAPSYIKIYDIHGKLVTQEKWENNKPHLIDTSKWLEGIYFVIIETNQQEKRYKKLVIMK